MNSYRYRISVEKLTNAKGEPVQGQCLSFYTTNHDDILAIVEKMQARLPIPASTAASLGVGLKLFGEIVLTHRSEPLFAKIYPALSRFVQQLKEYSAEPMAEG